MPQINYKKIFVYSLIIISVFIIDRLTKLYIFELAEVSNTNGIYVFNGAANAMTRHTDYNSTIDMNNNSGTLFKITSGTTNANTQFIMTLKDNGTLDAAGSKIIFGEYNSTLFELKSKTLNIYAVSYNGLRVMSGMASLAFSN